jgi:hypothetical protein
MKQDSQKYSREAGTVVERLGMRQAGWKYGMEARTVVRRSGMQQNSQKYSMEAGMAAGRLEILHVSWNSSRAVGNIA